MGGVGESPASIFFFHLFHSQYVSTNYNPHSKIGFVDMSTAGNLKCGDVS